MTRFLFVTWDGGGTLPPAFGIAQELRDRGHDVAFAGQELDLGLDASGVGLGAFADRTARRGFRFTRLERCSAAWRTGPPGHRLVTGLMACPEHLRDIPDAVAHDRYDALVVDGMLFGALAAAERGDLPEAVLVTSSPSAVAAPDGPLEVRLLAAVNGVRATAGLPAVASLWETWARATTICATVPELDPLAAQVPPSFAFVGPVFERVPASAWRSPWRADDPRPLVLVSFTTTAGWDQAPRIRRTLAALADRPYRVLVTAGRAASDGFAIPDNAVLVPHVPHGEVLPQTAVAVTHAGHGTVAAALAHGVPLVCLPNLGSDQPAVAAQVETLGAGRTLDGEPASPLEIARAVDDLLSDPSYAASANRLARAIAATPGAATAASRLEDLAQRPRHPPPTPVPAIP